MILNATALTTFEMAADGSSVRVNLLDAHGYEVGLTLPLPCVTALLITLPAIQAQALQVLHQDPSLRMVYPAHMWKLESSGDPECVILTLATPDGFKVSFGLNPNAILDMAQTVREATPSPLPHPATLQ